MYFPHTYRTMNGQEQGKDGLPGPYRNIEMKEIELYDVIADISETKNVAADHSEVIAKIKQLADAKRAEIGDSLTKVEGSENREPGRIN